jgi:hypothetical protein
MRQWIEKQGGGKFDADLACTSMNLDGNMAERLENCPVHDLDEEGER